MSSLLPPGPPRPPDPSRITPIATITGRLLRLIHRLRPGIAALDEPERTLAQLQMLLLLVTGPLALVALIWLALATDLRVVTDHAALLLALVALLALMQQHTFTIQVEVSRTELIPITGTLATLLVWSTALLIGPTVLWLQASVQAGGAVRAAWTGSRLGQSVRYGTLSVLSQSIGGEVFGFLSALAVFRALGGSYPLDPARSDQWLPAMAASLVAAVLPPAVIVPVIAFIHRLERGGQTGAMAGWWRSIMLFSVATLAPAAVLGAAIYVDAGAVVYLLYAAGIVAVNYLLHHLSRSNERSQQRERELARLEALSEALIEAPSDLSTLSAVLAEYVPSMFPQDRFELRLFAPSTAAPPGLTWPECHLVLPAGRPPVPERVWDVLWRSPATTLHLAHVQPPGTAGSYGDAVLVKVASDDPGREGGAKEKLLGGLALARRTPLGRAAHSLAALQALAAQIGAAYYRAHVHFETLAAQRMAQELALAGSIQATFLPHEIPRIPGWDLAAGLVPARQTSGDFYDFFALPGDRWGMLVADVADKGMGAALYMALSRTLIRTFAMQFPDAPEQALAAANERLLSDAKSDQFVTVFYGILDAANGALTYANAGHNPPFLLHPTDGAPTIVALKRTGIPLGLFETAEWRRGSAICEPGALLVLYTDGVSEAQNTAEEEFGESRLLAAAERSLGAPAATVYHTLRACVEEFVEGAAQHDDITLLIACRRAEL